MKRISGLAAVGLWLFAFSAAAQGLTLPYSGSATTSGSAFSVANYYSLSGGPYAIVATGYNQSSALNATSTNGYGVVSTTSAGWASTFTTNASGTWGTYTHSYGTAGLYAAGSGGQYAAYFDDTPGCGTSSSPGCLYQYNPLGAYAVASSTVRANADGYSHGLWVSAKDGAALKAFANGYWEPVVSIDALSSSSYGGVALQARGRSAYSYAAQISNVTGSSGLLVSAQSGGTALYVSGNVSISGTLYASVKNFQIDHPQHPDTQYLRHSVVESDGYKVQYDGNVLLNGSGEATVTVPGYVELVAGDFRYQLTPIGGPATVYIATELAGNQFKIAGGKAGMKVSWQLTGIRKDPAALADPLVVEAPKPATKVGTYIRPELYGRPSSESEANVGAVDRVAPATNSGKTLGAAQLTPPLLPQGN